MKSLLGYGLIIGGTISIIWGLLRAYINRKWPIL